MATTAKIAKEQKTPKYKARLAPQGRDRAHPAGRRLYPGVQAPRRRRVADQDAACVPEVRTARREADHRRRAHQPSRPPRLLRTRRRAGGPRRTGHGDSHDVAWRDDRPRSGESRRRRRSALQYLVTIQLKAESRQLITKS